MEKIKCLADLKPIIEDIRWKRFYDGKMEFYRGHGLRTYELKPGLTRMNIPAQHYLQIEKNIYEDFKAFHESKDDYIRLPFKDGECAYKLRNKWYSLFQAQHIGLKTRFMDWSIGFETALLFAVENEEQFGQDGSLWIFRVPREYEFNAEPLGEITAKIDPFEIDQNMMINTPTYMLDDKFDYVGEKRMGRQSGRFWMQPMDKAVIALEKQDEVKNHLLELIIDGDSKQKIKEELLATGVNRDWHYYRTDDNIDAEILKINKKYLQ
jgi:hypothetical protein